MSKTEQNRLPHIPTQSQLHTETLQQACTLAERECTTKGVEQGAVRMLEYLDAQCEASPGHLWMNIVFPVCNEIVDPPLSVRDHIQQRILTQYTVAQLNDSLPSDISVVRLTSDGIDRIEDERAGSFANSPNPAIVTEDGQYGGTVRITQQIRKNSQPLWPTTEMSDDQLINCLISYGDVHTTTSPFDSAHIYNMNTRTSAPFLTTNSFELVASNIARTVNNRRSDWSSTLDKHHTTDVQTSARTEHRKTPVTVLSGPEAYVDGLLHERGCWATQPTVDTDHIAVYIGGSQQAIRYVATVEQRQSEKTYVTANDAGSESWVSATVTNSRHVLSLSNISELDTPVTFTGDCSKMNRLGHHVETTMGSLVDAEQMSQIPELSE